MAFTPELSASDKQGTVLTPGPPPRALEEPVAAAMEMIGMAREAFRAHCLPVPSATVPLLLATTFCRASGSAEAAVRLTGIGFGFDGVKLGRSVLEDADVASWLAAECIGAEEAHDRAVAYRALQGHVARGVPGLGER